MYTVVLQAANSNGNDHLVHLRRAASASASATAEVKAPSGSDHFAQPRSQSSVAQLQGKDSGPSFRDLVMEYYGPGQRLREIYLLSREGEMVAVPITLAVQVSTRLREFVEKLMIESATQGHHDKAKQTLDVPCSTDALKMTVEFVTANLELDLKLSEEGIRMSEEQKKEHWREYIYCRVSWRMDLDDFADDILKVAEYLVIKSLYDLMKCCFRLRL